MLWKYVSIYIFAFMFTSIFSQYCNMRNIRMKIFDIYIYIYVCICIYRIKLAATLINSLLCLYIHTIYHIMAMGITSLSAFFYSVCKPIKSPSLVLLYILSMIPKKLYRFQRFDVTIPDRLSSFHKKIASFHKPLTIKFTLSCVGRTALWNESSTCRKKGADCLALLNTVYRINIYIYV
jgi:hypothetical protein